MKISIPLLFLLLLICPELNSQTPNWQWAKSAGRYTSHDYCNSISTDAQGNSFITGYFQDSLDLGNTTLLNSGSYNSVMYLAKFDNAGNCVWANTPGGNHSSEGNCIYTDAVGNFYVTGTYSGSIEFDTMTLTTIGPYNYFVAKYDTAGNPIWARNASGHPFVSAGTGVTADNNGNVFVTGTYEDSSIIFGSIVLPGNFISDIFTVKYDFNGNVIWAKSGNGHASDASNGICTDENGDVFITGVFRDSLVLGSTTLYGSSNGSAAVLVVKYDGSGNLLWAKSSGGFPSSGYGKGISTDVTGNCYIVGYFNSPEIYFDGDTLTNAGVDDVFLLKFNSAGNVAWARQGGGPSFDHGNSISTDDNGNSYITGFFKNTSTFGNIHFNGSGNDLFVVKYDSSGNVLWGIQNTGSVNDLSNGISIDGNNNVYISGEFSSPNSFFGTTTLVNSDQFLGSYDLLIAKLNILSTGIQDNLIENKSITIFPNPISKSGTILFDNSSGNIFTLTIYDSQGRIVRIVSEIKSDKIEIERGDLTPGLYFLRMNSDSNKCITGKFILQ